jgi:hypothetical protein
MAAEIAICTNCRRWRFSCDWDPAPNPSNNGMYHCSTCDAVWIVYVKDYPNLWRKLNTYERKGLSLPLTATALKALILQPSEVT